MRYRDRRGRITLVIVPRWQSALFGAGLVVLFPSILVVVWLLSRVGDADPVLAWLFASTVLLVTLNLLKAQSPDWVPSWIHLECDKRWTLWKATWFRPEASGALATTPIATVSTKGSPGGDFIAWGPAFFSIADPEDVRVFVEACRRMGLVQNRRNGNLSLPSEPAEGENP